MAEETAAGPRPAVPYLKIPEKGEPYLEGHRCKSCKAVFIGERTICASCGTRDQIEAISLSNKGELYVYSIVHRSFPGIEVPYISAIVDLEGGGTVKGNLSGIDPDPEKIVLGMPVKTVFKTKKDRQGDEYLVYQFQPSA